MDCFIFCAQCHVIVVVTQKKLQFIYTLHAALCNHYTLVDLMIGWMKESGQISHLVYSDWCQKAIWEKMCLGIKVQCVYHSLITWMPWTRTENSFFFSFTFFCLCASDSRGRRHNVFELSVQCCFSFRATRGEKQPSATASWLFEKIYSDSQSQTNTSQGEWAKIKVVRKFLHKWVSSRLYNMA